jgi:hypothetical protein
MISASDPTDGLELSRDDLSEAVRIVSALVEKWTKAVSLRFEDGWLYIEAGHGHAVAKAPARGCWPLTIIVGLSWVRRLAKNMPAGDPIRLHVNVEESRLYTNRYSERCSWTTVDSPFHPEVPELDVKAVISEAAEILKPLLIGREDLEKLISETHLQGASTWTSQEKKMISIIAKAWVLLAPLGIAPADIRRLADNAVRNAWK